MRGNVEQVVNNRGPDAFSLHRGCNTNGTQENLAGFLPLLNPAGICTISHDDAGLAGFEPFRKAFFLMRPVPPKATLNGPAHRFEVELTHEIEVTIFEGPKADIHGRRLPSVELNCADDPFSDSRRRPRHRHDSCR